MRTKGAKTMVVTEWLESIKGVNKALMLAQKDYKRASASRDTEAAAYYNSILEEVKLKKRAAENIIDRLPSSQLRLPMRLYYIEGLKWGEIAFIIGTSIPTAKNRCDKAIEELGTILDEIGAKYNIDMSRRNKK